MDFTTDLFAVRFIQLPFLFLITLFVHYQYQYSHVQPKPLICKFMNQYWGCFEWRKHTLNQQLILNSKISFYEQPHIPPQPNMYYSMFLVGSWKTTFKVAFSEITKVMYMNRKLILPQLYSLLHSAL